MTKTFRTIFCLIVLLSTAVGNIACSTTSTKSDETPLMMLRFRGTTTDSDEAWDKTFRIIKDNPGCCDEVWFSTGLGFPSFDLHRQQAERIARGTRELQTIGVSASLQVQMTIGHGDGLAVGEEERYVGKTWTGWTGSTGVEDKYCSCPRQPAFLDYMREMAHIYAETHPRSVWIDDDLRYNNHDPASKGSRLGCWCDTCIAHFNAATQGEWTAASLAAAIGTDTALATAWRQFSIGSLCDIARVIAEEFAAVSPDTRMGLQGVNGDGAIEVITAILSTLHEVSGNPVCYRPGGGAYYDNVNADDQIVKSMGTARFRKSMGDPEWIDSWCPEVESWPRVYGSRTAQGALVEGFTALAYGMDAVSLFVMAAEKESDTVYSQTMLRPLAKGAPMLKAYAKANEGTLPVGYSTDVTGKGLYTFACTAIPVLPGCGKELGRLTAADISRPHFTTEVSTKVQELREEIHARQAAPVVCCSPFIGLLVPRVDAEGNLRTIALQNVRIDAQGPIRLRIDNLPEKVKHVQWYEMKKKPVRLSVERTDGKAFITLPELEAWNAGFVHIK